jgi:3-oxoacyl-[acyl-carrier-protein] synthase-3
MVYVSHGNKNTLKNKQRRRQPQYGLQAIDNALSTLPYSVEEVDLIIHASYSPLDTVATLAHVVQQKYNIINAKAFYISSACSTFVNAVEIVQTYFLANKATKALIVASEHNSYYNDETCEKSGHFWGDGAAALFISKEKIGKNEPKIIDVFTKGLGHIGKGPEGVFLRPKTEGLVMPFGRDVFQHACGQMIDALSTVLQKNNLSISDLDYIIPHQANMRIISNIANQLKINPKKMLCNIESIGNTGCASTAIVLSQYWKEFVSNQLIGITVFGGGYSIGSLLIKI